jgi:hypothetical protein
MKTSLWNDRDWRELPLEAQWAYEMLCQQQALSYVGIIDFRPGRWAVFAQGATTRRVNDAVKALEKARWVIVDRSTEELLVRSYVRHDGVMDRFNMGKAVGRAWDKVTSLPLRDAVLSELARLYGEKPTLAGFNGFADLYPDAMQTVTAMSSTIPFPMASGKA